MLKFILVFALVSSLSVSGHSQQQSGPGAQDPNGTSSLSGTRRQLATIIFCGLGGAILGLSTLSFYGRPQDYMANIAIGFAVGIIGGTVIVTYKSASSPSQLEPGGAPKGAQDFTRPYGFGSRELADARESGSNGGGTPTLGLQFSF